MPKLPCLGDFQIEKVLTPSIHFVISTHVPKRPNDGGNPTMNANKKIRKALPNSKQSKTRHNCSMSAEPVAHLHVTAVTMKLNTPVSRRDQPVAASLLSLAPNRALAKHPMIRQGRSHYRQTPAGSYFAGVHNSSLFNYNLHCPLPCALRRS